GTIKAFEEIPSEKKSMTVDNGKEFAEFKDLEKGLGMTVYFAHQYSSWERGLNENTNGLLREFFPKGMDLRKITRKDVEKAVGLLNNRPRKCLGYRTPVEAMATR
ncbi:MAG: IS30 family transposase, partial [Planctomycetota bacterium]